MTLGFLLKNVVYLVRRRHKLPVLVQCHLRGRPVGLEKANGAGEVSRSLPELQSSGGSGSTCVCVGSADFDNQTISLDTESQ